MSNNGPAIPNPSGTAPPPAAEVGSADAVRVLQLLAEAAAVPFDPTRAGQCVRQAERAIPPTATRAARLRLVQAAECLGLHVLTSELSIHEALQRASPQTPLALFTLTPGGAARWFVLTEGRRGRGRLARLAAGDDDTPLTADALARRFGAAGPDTVLEWLTAVPAAPLAPATAHAPDDDHADTHHGPGPLTRLWGLLRPERGDLWAVVIYAVGIGLLSLAVPVTAMAVVNTAALATLMQQLLVFCLVLFVCLGLGAFLRALQAVVVEYMQQRLFVRVTGDLAHRLPRIDLTALDQQHGPELVNRFFDVLTVQKAGAALLLDGVAVVLQTVIGLILLAAYHEMLLGFDLFLIAGLVFIVFGLGRGAVASAIRESLAKYRVAAWLEELARHPRAFKLGGGPRFARERADGLARSYLLARQHHFAIVLRQFAFALGLQVLASTALLGLGGYLVIQGQLTLGQLVAAEIVVALVVASFTKLGKQLESYYDLLAAVDKLGHLIDLPLERAGGESQPALPGHGAALKVQALTFRYDRASGPALDGFSLTVAPGEHVALVGPNGSGKSTLVDLLFGLRAPLRGYVELDGVDLREYDLTALRDHVAVVKGVEIFEASILDNVRMGREELTTADVRATLATVGLLAPVLDLPDGLYTALSTGGQPLSLGQAERLMLARALVGRPRLLVLDETLDNLDRQHRDGILTAVLGPDARWSALVVTHNPEIADRCDRQVFLGRPAGSYDVSAAPPAEPEMIP